MSGAGPGFFFRRGCTRLLLYFNTSKPPNFFLQNTSCIRKPQVISGGGGRTPCTLPLDPPLVVYNDIYSVTMCGVVFGYVPNGGAMPLVKDVKMKNQIN